MKPPRWLGIAAVAALGYALCDLLHELGHLAVTLLPLGVTPVTISTIGLSSSGSHPLVALAGSAVNLALAIGLILALSASLPPAWKWFLWVLGTVDLFNASAYLLYSAILGSGDWAAAIGERMPAAIWRPVLGASGLAAYAASVHASSRVLIRLVNSRVVAAASIDRYCATTYWTGGALLTLGAVFNPVSPMLILTSGAATGFGAMLGLFAVPVLARRNTPDSAEESLRIGWAWVVAAAMTAAVFVGVFGPGVRLTR